MYRLLTINRVAIENCRLAVYGHKKHVVGLKEFGSNGGGIIARHDTNAFLLQPARYHIINNDHQKAVYCHLQQNIPLIKPVVPCQSFNENVLSTTTTNGGEFKYILYAYICLVM